MLKNAWSQFRRQALLSRQDSPETNAQTSPGELEERSGSPPEQSTPAAPVKVSQEVPHTLHASTGN